MLLEAVSKDRKPVDRGWDVNQPDLRGGSTGIDAQQRVPVFRVETSSMRGCHSMEDISTLVHADLRLRITAFGMPGPGGARDGIGISLPAFL